MAGDGVFAVGGGNFGSGVRARLLGAARAIHRRSIGTRRDRGAVVVHGSQLPFAGIVFAVDGVLLGAGDAAFMRTATVASALVGFLPLVWLSLAYGWGLAGIWSGLGTFIVLRLIFVGWRAYSGRWAVTGAA